MIIDVHSHYYPDFYLDTLKGPQSPFEFIDDESSGIDFFHRGGFIFGLPRTVEDIDERIGAMRDVGIDTQILSMAGPSVSFLGTRVAHEMTMAINDSMLGVCRRAPGRFLMFASVELFDFDSAISELKRLAGEPELAGLMTRTHVGGRRLDDATFDTFWEEVNRQQLTVFVHPTIPLDEEIAVRDGEALYIGFPQETAKLIAAMHFGRMFDRYPEINWIFCHLGGGIHSIWDRFKKSGERAALWQPPSMAFDEVSKRIYCDCVSGHAPAIRLTYDTIGAQQMVYGSDCPHIPLGVSLAALRSLHLPRAEEQLILSDNAQAILSPNRGG